MIDRHTGYTNGRRNQGGDPRAGGRQAGRNGVVDGSRIRETRIPSPLRQ